MKWIGQHIWDFISRFRSDVYLDSPSAGGSDPDKFLGIDANNKIIYRTGAEVLSDIGASSESTDLEFNGSTANGVLTYGGAAQIDVESAFTYDGNNMSLAALTSTFTNATNSQVIIKNTGNNTAGGILDLINERGTGVDGDDAGIIRFYADDAGGNPTHCATIKSYISRVNEGSENGSLRIEIESGNQQSRPALVASTTNGDDIVNAALGYGATSTATISGDLTVTSKATIPSRTYAYPGTTDGNHTAGDIMYYDSGTASTTAGKIYYFNGSGSWTIANADAVADATGMLAVALGTNPDVDGMLLRGFVTLYDINGTEDHGAKLYLHTVDGEASVTAPGSGNLVRVIGYNLHNTNDSVYFNPDSTYVKVS